MYLYFWSAVCRHFEDLETNAAYGDILLLSYALHRYVIWGRGTPLPPPASDSSFVLTADVDWVDVASSVDQKTSAVHPSVHRCFVKRRPSVRIQSIDALPHNQRNQININHINNINNRWHSNARRERETQNVRRGILNNLHLQNGFEDYKPNCLVLTLAFIDQLG